MMWLNLSIDDHVTHAKLEVVDKEKHLKNTLLKFIPP